MTRRVPLPVVFELWQVWHFGTNISSVVSTPPLSARRDKQFFTLILQADIAKHLPLVLRSQCLASSPSYNQRAADFCVCFILEFI
jgi:hypothetical protein